MEKYERSRALIIIRGLPGSGKSSFAKLIDSNPDFICTADDFLMEDGKYNWSPERAGMAHKKCQAKCENLMRLKFPKIIVANTSTTEKELKPYYDLARNYGYQVFSVIVENRHGGTNEHDVPETTLEKMLNRFNIKLI
jgi:predicted kinase